MPALQERLCEFVGTGVFLYGRCGLQGLKRRASDGVRRGFQGGGVTRVIPPTRRIAGRRWNGITPPGF